MYFNADYRDYYKDPELSEHDKALIAAALKTRWEDTGKYSDQCESELAKAYIKAYDLSQYHRYDD